MANTDGMKMKYIGILKVEGIEKHLTESQQNELLVLLDTIEIGRQNERKLPTYCNKYLVINTDEPYADEVIEIMKRYGHWG